MWGILILVGIVSFLIYQIFKPSKDYWSQFGVRQIEGASFIENIQVFRGKKTFADLDDVAYEKIGSDKLGGLVQLQQPVLLLKDLNMVKQIMIKDFEYFMDRRTLNIQKPMDKMLINMEGDDWKSLRASLSPTFTTGKIRRMMEIFNQVGNEWIGHFKSGITNSGSNTFSINVPKESLNYTIDVIAAAAFGMKAGVIANPQTEFTRMFQRISDTSFLKILKFKLAVVFPKIVQLLGIRLMDGEAFDYFENILSQALKARMEGKEKRNDFLQLIIESRKGELKGVGSDELSDFEKEAQLSLERDKKKNLLEDDEYANAQMILFFFSGASTTSNFIGFALYMLALHPQVQSKLREEVNSKLFNDGDGKTINYDALNRLVYLDMVSCEVLRKFPPLGRLERKCVKDYHDPTENLKVPKGTVVGVPLQAIHNDKQYYEYPEKFYPDHFAPETKANRNPYAYMPFGSGPRNCIGMRFALVEGKAAIAHLVHNFKIEPTEKTPIPYQVKPVGIGFQLPDNLELSLTLAN